MIPHWENLLALFPFSKLSQRELLLRVHAVNFSEPLLCEYAFPLPFDSRAAVAAAREFQNEDCAYQLECAWDLMQVSEDEEWKLAPLTVSLWCFGPAFENEITDHIRVEFGLEDNFLPQPGDEASIHAAQANLRSLLRLVEQIGRKLPVERRHLWSESGVNFAEKLQYELAGDGPAGMRTC